MFWSDWYATEQKILLSSNFHTQVIRLYSFPALLKKTQQQNNYKTNKNTPPHLTWDLLKLPKS